MLRVICLATALMLAPMASAVDVYAVDRSDYYPSTLWKFDSNNVAGMRVLGSMRMYAVTSLEWAGSTLYAYGDGLQRWGLYRINPNNAESTFIGTGGVEPGIDIQDFSFNPRDGQLYALGAVRFPYFGTYLYTINTANGYATKLGKVTGLLPAWELSVGLAADLDGAMYIAELDLDQMYRLPFGSLNATPLPEPVGFQLYDGGMTIDWAGDGRWHFAAHNASPYRTEYRLVDKSTGATTLVGPFPNNPLITDLAIVPEPAALALLGVAALALRRR